MIPFVENVYNRQIHREGDVLVIAGGLGSRSGEGLLSGYRVSFEGDE